MKNCGTRRAGQRPRRRGDRLVLRARRSATAETAGVVLLEIDGDGELEETAALRDQEAPALFSSVVSLGGTRAVHVGAPATSPR